MLYVTERSNDLYESAATSDMFTYYITKIYKTGFDTQYFIIILPVL